MDRFDTYQMERTLKGFDAYELGCIRRGLNACKTEHEQNIFLREAIDARRNSVFRREMRELAIIFGTVAIPILGWVLFVSFSL